MKDFKVEVRISHDEFKGSDQLSNLAWFTSTAQDVIKRKLVDAVVDKYVSSLPELDMDLSDLKELVKQGIVDRKIDEVLES